MQKIILEKLSAFRLKLFSMRQRLESWSRIFPGAYPLLDKYNQHVLSWLSEWHERFFQEASQTLSVAQFRQVFQRKSLELQAFFHLRYHYLPFNIADFTQAPFLLSHRALLAAAHLMAEENNSVCHMMMPWVERVIGSADETDIKSATEELNGDFKLCHFITAGADQNALIAVMDYLDYVRDSHAIAKIFFSSLHPIILERVFHTPLRNYVRALEYFYQKATLDPACFAYHVYRLALSLHERSVSRGGNEEYALSEYENVIVEFYTVWHALSSRDRESLSILKISCQDKYNLQDYLLVIFSSVPVIKIKLSAEELSLERHNNIIHCANILSSTLLSFLHQYTEAWSRLMVRVSDHLSPSVVYTRDQLNEFRNTLLETINDSKKRARDSLLLNDDVSVNEKYQGAHDQFIAVTTLLFLLNETTFEYFFSDFKRRFSLAQHVFTFFSAVQDKEICTKFWIAHQAQWKKLFVAINDIMVLTHFLCERGVDIVLDLFKKEIETYQPVSFLYPDNPRLCFYFMLAIVKKFPQLIKTVRGFLDYVLNCETPRELDLFFSAVAPRLPVLFSMDGKLNGERWIIFLEFLDRALRGRTFPRIDSGSIYTACCEYILPLFVGRESIRACWDRDATGCLACLFRLFGQPRSNARDLFVYDALLDVYQHYSGHHAKITINDLKQILACLKGFTEKNEGGQFLKSVREFFRGDFFKKTSDALSLIRYAAPDLEVQVMSPRLL